MTRINLVPPEELTDQHLFAEFREIKMVPKALARSIRARGIDWVRKHVPPAFTLNTGHVRFFYDKGQYLFERFQALRAELERRRVNFNRASGLDPDDIFGKHPELFGHYTPTTEALQIIRARITEKIALKPSWYRYMGEPIAVNGYPEAKP